MASYKEQRYYEISSEEIVNKAKELFSDGYRLEQICAISKNGETTLLYSFDKEKELINYKVEVPLERVMVSITSSYWSAFIYENEIHDLFDVTFTDSKLDYKGNFFKTKDKFPWKTEKEAE